jgi:hemerythrin-like domain-containing protein
LRKFGAHLLPAEWRVAQCFADSAIDMNHGMHAGWTIRIIEALGFRFLGVDMASAIERIQSEHRDYARVLSCLRDVVQYLRAYDGRRLAAPGHRIQTRKVPDLNLLYSIIYYIRVFPNQFHHPKEEHHLFRAVRMRSPNIGEVLDQLVDQHTTGERLIDELDAALKAYEKNYPSGLEDLATKAENFIASQRQHMRLEEEKIIPAAKMTLTEIDWRDIDDAFAGNADPLFGENLETAFHSLHDHIVKGAEAV